MVVNNKQWKSGHSLAHTKIMIDIAENELRIPTLKFLLLILRVIKATKTNR